MFRSDQFSFVVALRPSWAPVASAHFLRLARQGIFVGSKLRRTNNFVQLGEILDAHVAAAWVNKTLQAEPARALRGGGGRGIASVHNRRATLAFGLPPPAHGAEARAIDRRGTRNFITLHTDGSVLDKSGYIPFAEIVDNASLAQLDALPEGTSFDLVGTHELVTTSFSAKDMLNLLGSSGAVRTSPVLSVRTSTGKLPDPTLRVRCGTTKGNFDIIVHPAWAPIGARRFIDMVNARYFDGSSFFRVLRGFLVQFGLAADPALWRFWDGKGLLKDDTRGGTVGVGSSKTMRFAPPPRIFPRGGLSFAGWGPNSRATNLFIAYKAGVVGESPWETPFGVVTEQGMSVLTRLYSAYGELDMGKIQRGGNAWIKQTGRYEKLDYFTRCKVVPHGEDHDSAQLTSDYHHEMR